MLEEAAKLAESELAAAQPLRRRGGLHATRTASVRTPRGFHGSLRARSATAAGPASPRIRNRAARACPSCVNLAIDGDVLPAPTSPSASIPASATAPTMRWRSTPTSELQAIFLPRLVDGTWSGTMCLTEPQCGTDLGLIRTRAVPDGGRQLPHHRHQDLHQRRRARPDREHRPSGAGEAARCPGRARAASACSSCPSSCPSRHRTAGAAARATASAAPASSTRWASAPRPPAPCSSTRLTGWLVGAPHKGMAAMFTMMNAARLAVGMQGLAVAEAAYQDAARLCPGAAAGPLACRRPMRPISRPTRSSSTPTCAGTC